MVALYIHWPFCKKKCPYCDFNSHVRASVDYERWERALLTEMQTMHCWAKQEPLTSIFFGGGTPSLMPPDIVASIIDKAQSLWQFTNDIEITLEANPTSAESKRFRHYKDAGVNRLSLGVQSLHDKELQFLGREHSAAEALDVVEMAAGIFERYSFDLIYARPHQTVSQWRDELAKALTYTNGHISLYQLTVEPDTIFARVYQAGGFALPEDDVAADLYEVTQEMCADAGLQRYEISNYASCEEESRHNISYWTGDAYIGVGAGAHGRYVDHTGNWLATETLKSPERWIEAVERDSHAAHIHHVIDSMTRKRECLLSGLRLRKGVLFNSVEEVIDEKKLQLLCEHELVALNNGMLSVNERGTFVLERIIGELLNDF